MRSRGGSTAVAAAGLPTSAGWARAAVPLALAFLCTGGPAAPALRADTVALWLFDEKVAVDSGSVLSDAGPGSHYLLLGPGAELVTGRFGHALRTIPLSPLVISPRSSFDGRNGSPPGPQPPRSGRVSRMLVGAGTPSGALSTNGDGHPPRSPFRNATDSRLNLGAHDWTVECWLRLDPAVQEEGVLWEIGTGPRGENELLTRISVLPRENAFALAGLAPPVRDARVTRRVEFPNPEGPPGGEADLWSATLAADGGPLPRATWFHLAFVHAEDTADLTLYLDGKRRAVAPSRLRALPRGDEAYVSVGGDGTGGRPFLGAIDELRVSDHRVYTGDFAPPGSFSRLDSAGLRTSEPLAKPPLGSGRGKPRTVEAR